MADDFAAIDDPQERLSFAVDRGRHHASLPADAHTDAHLIPGCVSQAWITGELTREGLTRFRCDAASPLVKGLLGLLCEFFSNAPAAEVALCELDPLATLRLTRDLTPTRQNGLAHARARIREIAARLQPQP